ncbi:MAG: DHHW family protein [Clostridia bacterium]|nr:DHHW family protein [Clostridia bacterium]
MDNNLNNIINEKSEGSFSVNIRNGRPVSSQEEPVLKKTSLSELLSMLDDAESKTKSSEKTAPPKPAEKNVAAKPVQVSEKPPITASQPALKQEPVERPVRSVTVKPENTIKTKEVPVSSREHSEAHRTVSQHKTENRQTSNKKPQPVKPRFPDALKTKPAAPEKADTPVAKIKSKPVEAEKADTPKELTPQEIAAQRAEERRQRAWQKKVNHVCRVSALIFIAVIFLVNFINLVTPDKEKSVNESRALQAFPAFSISGLLDGSWGDQLEDYVSDQFFGRDSWISIKLSEDKLLGRKEVNGVYLGKNGYLMEVPDEVNFENVDKNLDALNDFAYNNPSLNIDMAIIPNAVTTMPDYLPKNQPVRNQRADLAYLINRLPSNINFIDTTATLTAHQDDYIYYRTDHHWTSLGAYYAFMDMAADLGIANPITAYNIYTVTDSFEGTMASKSGSHEKKYRDSIDVYVPAGIDTQFYVTYNDTYEKSPSLYQSAMLNEKDKYTVFLGGNHGKLTINTTNNNGKVLLIFKDSYANCFVQFLTPYYEEIVMIDPRYYYDSISSIIESEAVTDVLFLYNVNTYMGDTNLCNALKN